MDFTGLSFVGRNASIFYVTLRFEFYESLNINNILSQIKQLDKNDQLTLLQRMAYLLKKKESNDTTPTRLSALSGMGSEIWKKNRAIFTTNFFQQVDESLVDNRCF